MKVLFVLSALAAVALAKPGLISPAGVSPLAYNAAYPFYNNLGYSALGYNNYAGIPHSYGYAAAAPVATTYAAAPIAATYAAAPVAYAAAPYAAYAVPSVTKTQYHAQDEFGQASYGYAHPGQVHNAVRDAHGNVAGSYSYVDPNGKIVKTDYIADGAGFRVASNALPVAPAVPLAPHVVLPVGPAPVQDTPEVVEARNAHLAEVAAVRSRSKRGVAFAAGYPYAAYPYAHGYSSVVAAPAFNAYAAHTYASPALTYAAPALTYAAPALTSYAAAPALRAATLTTVVNNPGHAVSYRVD